MRSCLPTRQFLQKRLLVYSADWQRLNKKQTACRSKPVSCCLKNHESRKMLICKKPSTLPNHGSLGVNILLVLLFFMFLGLGTSANAASYGSSRLSQSPEEPIVETVPASCRPSYPLPILGFTVAHPFPPPDVFYVTHRSDGHVEWRWEESKRMSNNLYIASEPGILPQNYHLLENGMRITDVSSPYTMMLDPGRTWYGVVTSVYGGSESYASHEVVLRFTRPRPDYDLTYGSDQITMERVRALNSVTALVQQIPMLNLHLDAQALSDENNAEIQSWPNSGLSMQFSNHHVAGSFEQIMNSPEFHAEAINGYPGVYFNGVSESLWHASSVYTEEVSFAAVFRTGENTRGFQVIYNRESDTSGYQLSLANEHLYLFRWHTCPSAGMQYYTLDLGAIEHHKNYQVLVVHDLDDGEGRYTASGRLTAWVNRRAPVHIDSVPRLFPRNGIPTVGGVSPEGARHPISHTAVDYVSYAPIGSTSFRGHIGEIMSWGHELTIEERMALQSYLKLRWKEEFGWAWSLPAEDQRILHLDSQNPQTLPGRNNQYVQEWHDQSGQGNHFSQSERYSMPRFAIQGINNKPAVKFDGYRDLLAGPDAASLIDGVHTDQTIAIVFRTGSNVNGERIIYQQGEAGQGYRIYVRNGVLYGGDWSSTQPVVHQDLLANTAYSLILRRISQGNASHMTVIVDGRKSTWNIVDSAGTVPSTVSTNLGGGIHWSNSFLGHIGEIIAWDTALSYPQILMLHHYFSHRWGILVPDSQLSESNRLNLGAIKQSIFPGDPEFYTLTTSASPASGGVVHGAGEYVSGDVAVLHVETAEGYRFSHWGGGLDGSEEILTHTMNASIAVVAHFVQQATQVTLAPAAPIPAEPVRRQYPSGESGISLERSSTLLVGETAGTLSAQGGAARYSIPITVPPGVGSFQPKLSLTYSSHGGNGNLGIGFSITGMSSIHRCRPTLAQDGIGGGVNYNSGDRYCLDGQRLRPIQGTNGENGTEYRTEIDTYSRIVSYGSQGGGPVYWRVKTKSGQEFYYGYMAASRMEAQGKQAVRIWTLNMVRDAGNPTRAWYYYREDSSAGEYYITHIDYSSASGRRRVVFEYDSHPHTRVFYKGGSKITLSKRLRHIKTMLGTRVVRDYRLSYSTSDMAGYSTLTSVQECFGSNSDSQCLPATTFSWIDTRPLIAPLPAGLPNYDPSYWQSYFHFFNHVEGGSASGIGLVLSRGRYDLPDSMPFVSSDQEPLDEGTRLLDLDGDGKLDLIRGDSGVSNSRQAWINNGRDWELSIEYLPPVDIVNAQGKDEGTRFVDLNADGLPDILRSKGNIRNAWLNTGSGWTAMSGYNPPYEFVGSSYRDKGARFADLNGDGRPDLMQANSCSVTAYLNTGSGWTVGSGFRLLTSGPRCFMFVDSNGNDQGGRIADINGDGLPDLLRSKGNYGALQYSSAYLNQGNSFRYVSTLNPSVPFVDNSLRDTGTRVLDVNGDGISDIVYGPSETPVYSNRGGGIGRLALALTGTISRTYLGTGVGWIRSDTYLPPVRIVSSSFKDNGVRFVDLNADGLIDILQGAGTTRKSWVNTGSGWVMSTKYAPKLSFVDANYKDLGVRIGDIHGDGLVDIIHAKGGVDRAIYINQGRYTWITAVASGMGNRSSISYSPLTDTDIYTKGGRMSYPLMTLQSPQYVVSRVETTSPTDAYVRAMSYRYERLSVDLRGRGFLGFEVEEEIDHIHNKRIRTVYRSDFPFTGQVSRKLEFINGFIKKRKANNYFDSSSYSQHGVYAPKPTFVYEDNIDLDATLLSSIYTAYVGGSHQIYPNIGASSTYDANGNVHEVESTIYDRVNNLLWRTLTQNTWADNTSGDNWLLGRLSRAKVTYYTFGYSPIGFSPGTQLTSSYTYDRNGLLSGEVVEPDATSMNLKLTTAYGRNSFGDINRVSRAGYSATGTPLPTRISSVAISHQSIAGQYVSYLQEVHTNAIGHRETRQYDPEHGNLVRLTDANGLTTRWEYDKTGRKILEVQPDGTRTSWLYRWQTWNRGIKYSITKTSTGQAPVTVWYDSLGREVRTETYAMDGRPVYTQSHYDEKGQLIRYTRPHFEENAGFEARMEYDPLGRITLQALPDANGEEIITRYAYNDFTTTITDAKGHERIEHGNAKGELLRVTEPARVSLEFTYDLQGRLVQSRDANGRVSTTGYDILGRKISSQAPATGNQNSWTYAYNSFGELERQTDAKNNVETRRYDNLGRLVGRTESEGATVWTYDTAVGSGVGQIHQVRGPYGYIETYAYDNKSRLLSKTIRNASIDYTHSYTYDSRSQLLRHTYPSGFYTENTYNSSGYLTKVYSQGSTGAQYSPSRLRAESRSFMEGLRSSYHQAALFLAQAEQYQSRADRYKRISNLYANNRWLANSQMSLDRYVRYLHAHARYYQEQADIQQSRITQLQQEAAAAGIELQYQFESLLAATHSRIANDLTSMASDALLELRKGRNGFDIPGRGIVLTISHYLDKAEEHAALAKESLLRAEHLKNRGAYAALLEEMANDATNITWWRADKTDAEGRVTRAIHGNGIVSTRHYHPANGRLHWLRTGKVMGTGDEIQNLRYTFDALDNITSREDRVLNQRAEYTYDALNRLTKQVLTRELSTGFSTETKRWRYNNGGDIAVSSDSGIYSYQSSTGHLLSTTVHGAVSHDANGNVVLQRGINIAWSSFNKPVRFSKGTQVTTFRYSPDRSRYLKTENGQTTLYAGKTYEKNLTSNEHTHYIYARGYPVASYSYRTGAGNTRLQKKTRYLHADALGSIEVFTDGLGQVTERSVYDPFGNRTLQSASGETPIGTSVAHNGLGFTGHEQISFNLVHMNGRVYDPLLGRMLSPDPLIQSPALSQSHNRYAYVMNNPLRYTDPSGYFLGKIFKGISRGVRNVFRNKYVRAVVAIAANVFLPGPLGGGLTAHILVGATSGAIVSGGDPSSALIGGITGGIFYGLSDFFSGASDLFPLKGAEKVVVHGVVGGAASKASGGKFAYGFWSGVGARALQLSGVYDVSGSVHRTVVEALSGGVLSVVGGGRFSNGAAMAGFARMFGDFANYAKGKTDGLIRNACETHAKQRCVVDSGNGDVVLRTDGTRRDANLTREGSYSIFSDFGMAYEGSGKHIYENNRIMRYFIIDVSKIHDWMNSWRYNANGLYMSRDVWSDTAFDIYSFLGMPVAAAATVTGYVGRATPSQRILYYNMEK